MLCASFEVQSESRMIAHHKNGIRLNNVSKTTFIWCSFVSHSLLHIVLINISLNVRLISQLHFLLLPKILYFTSLLLSFNSCFLYFHKPINLEWHQAMQHHDSYRTMQCKHDLTMTVYIQNLNLIHTTECWRGPGLWYGSHSMWLEGRPHSCPPSNHGVQPSPSPYQTQRCCTWCWV